MTRIARMTRITSTGTARLQAPVDFSIKLGGWTEVQEDSQVYSQGFDVIPELTAGALGKTLGGLDLDDNGRSTSMSMR